MPVWMFRRFVGDDSITMWRWLRTARFEIDPAPTRELLPTVRTVREWLTQRQTPAPC